MVDDFKGLKRDVLYEFINYLEELKASFNYGDWLKNDAEIFYENCIIEVEDFIERYED